MGGDGVSTLSRGLYPNMLQIPIWRRKHCACDQSWYGFGFDAVPVFYTSPLHVDGAIKGELAKKEHPPAGGS